MFFKKIFKSKASIGSNSNNNIIAQNIDKLIVCNGASDIVEILSKAGHYEEIQKYTSDFLKSIKKSHPLYPDFSAKHHDKLNKLVSTAETEEALKKYPKRIKGEFLIDYKKYPYMDKSETPWEYAYRTQTKVKLETTAYKEYLGDVEDPFPVAKYEEGMITVIGAPQFPPAVDAMVSSGDISIPIKLRRKVCMQYGKVVIGTISTECGFDLNITLDENKTNVNISKVLNDDICAQLQRERLFNEFFKTRQIIIKIGSLEVVNGRFTEKDMSSSVFEKAPYLINYFSCLLEIEKHFGIKFKFDERDVDNNLYEAVLTFASSLHKKWHSFNMDYDDEIHCNYDNIPDSFFKTEYLTDEKTFELENINFELYNQKFSIEKYIIIYRDAKINNLSSVIKNCKRRKKGILITFRPIEDKDYFKKICHFAGIKLLNENK